MKVRVRLRLCSLAARELGDCGILCVYFYHNSIDLSYILTPHDEKDLKTLVASQFQFDHPYARLPQALSHHQASFASPG